MIFFVFVGSAKLFRAKPLNDQFIEFGLPGYPILVVGGLEVLGGILLLFPNLTIFSAIGLIILLIGALANHIKFKHPFKSMLPAIISGIALIILSIII